MMRVVGRREVLELDSDCSGWIPLRSRSHSARQTATATRSLSSPSTTTSSTHRATETELAQLPHPQRPRLIAAGTLRRPLSERPSTSLVQPFFLILSAPHEQLRSPCSRRSRRSRRGTHRIKVYRHHQQRRGQFGQQPQEAWFSRRAWCKWRRSGISKEEDCSAGSELRRVQGEYTARSSGDLT